VSVNDSDWLANQFEHHRERLRAVAYRMLGSTSEADDAIQDAWLRLIRADAGAIENLGGWLTTVVGRVCLDMLRARSSRREEGWGDFTPERVVSDAGESDPEHQAVVADSVGLALLVVLDTLTPAERVAFVLHDLFAVPFEEVAPIVGRSPTAARQLASRARRRVRGASVSNPDRTRQRAVVDAFLAASRGGDFQALLLLLDPDVVLRSDRAAIDAGAPGELHGAPEVAQTFAGRARLAKPALLGGAVGLVWAPGGTPRVAFEMAIRNGRIVGIEIIADADRLGALDVTILDETGARA
jgi:RNA polymerase sigma factor (sigma-70 family)